MEKLLAGVLLFLADCLGPSAPDTNEKQDESQIAEEDMREFHSEAKPTREFDDHYDREKYQEETIRYARTPGIEP